MFQVWNNKGVPTPYVAGSIKAGRAAPHTPDPTFTTTSAELPVDSLVNPYQRISLALERREPIFIAQQIMNTPVLSVGENATFAEALELIESHRFRHLPVISSSGKLVGIISDRDLLRRAANCNSKERESLSKYLVKSLMHTNVLSASPDTEVKHIAQVMFEERIGSMPIVNELQKLEGILTRSDILRAVVAKGPEELWM